MKRLLTALFAAAAMAPMVSYAQSSAPLTRAEVESQVAQAQHNGTLHQSKVHYPDTQGMIAKRDDGAYGSSTESTAQSGWVTQPSPQALGQSLYNHR